MNTSFKYTIQSRPTMYKGREYTSELEAAWACFFDLRGTIAEYEPLLDLKAWRPDFHITIQEEQLISLVSTPTQTTPNKLDFGETTIVKQDWERARNTVKWRP